MLMLIALVTRRKLSWRTYFFLEQSTLVRFDNKDFKKKTCILHFQDSLHLTVTKTFMEVLTTLSKAFADAYKRNLTARDTHLAPYRIINQTGKNVSVAVRQSGFQVRLL